MYGSERDCSVLLEQAEGYQVSCSTAARLTVACMRSPLALDVVCHKARTWPACASSPCLRALSSFVDCARWLHFQVRRLEQEDGKDTYEIHAQLPGINKEGVKYARASPLPKLVRLSACTRSS